MRLTNRLFWKILFAFALTFFLMVQAVGLVLMARANLANGEGSRPAPPQLIAAAYILETQGPAAVEQFRARLPSIVGDRIVVRQSDQSDGTGEVTRVRAPDGDVYSVKWDQDGDRLARTILGVPAEVLLIGLLGGFAFSAALAFYLTIPLDRLRTGFAKLAKGELQTRLATQMGGRRDEIAELGRHFDAMAQRLEDLVAARVRLLHDVSHEFRSPLARIQLATSLAEQSPEHVESGIKRIDLEVERLNGLVDELLTLTRIEAEDLSLEGEFFDPPSLIDSIIADARFEAKDTETAISLTVKGVPAHGEPPSVSGDPRIIRRAIENMLRNALRYAPKGTEITVSLELDEARSRYLIEICDTGPGVAPGMLGAIFDPFVRSDEATKGFGLGLAIAKRAIEAHGGRVTAQNLAPHGLCMRVTLPVAAVRIK